LWGLQGALRGLQGAYLIGIAQLAFKKLKIPRTYSKAEQPVPDGPREEGGGTQRDRPDNRGGDH